MDSLTFSYYYCFWTLCCMSICIYVYLIYIYISISVFIIRTFLLASALTATECQTDNGSQTDMQCFGLFLTFSLHAYMHTYIAENKNDIHVENKLFVVKRGRRIAKTGERRTLTITSATLKLSQPRILLNYILWYIIRGNLCTKNKGTN